MPLPQINKGAAGFDFYCKESVTVEPKQIAIVKLNAGMKVPEGYALFVMLRSSTPWFRGLMLANGAGIVDPYFDGDESELVAELYNFTDEPVQVNRGDKLVQGIFIKHDAPVWDEVEHLDGTGIAYSTVSDEG